MKSSTTGPVFIMVAAFLWAADALIRTPITRTIPATSIVMYEHLFGLLILSPLFIRSIPILKKITTSQWGYLFLLTIVSSVGGTILFTQALASSFATGDFITPLLLQKLQPVIVIALSSLFLKEYISKKYIVWAGVALIGSYLMSFGLTLPTFALQGKELVILLALGATICWGTGTIISKKLLKTFSTRDTTFLRFLLAVPISFLLSLFIHQTYSPFLMSQAEAVRFIAITLSTGAVGLLIYYYGLAKTPAHISTIAELIFPLTSIVIGITALNPYGAAQTLTLPQIVGIGMLLISVIFISSLSEKSSKSMVINGKIIHGSGDGTKLGFPTANIELKDQLNIEYGVYACYVIIEKEVLKGVLHYGPRLVFGETIPQFEVHILHFNKKVYGKIATVEIKDFVRRTVPFISVKEMSKQIKLDCIESEKALK